MHSKQTTGAHKIRNSHNANNPYKVQHKKLSFWPTTNTNTGNWHEADSVNSPSRWMQWIQCRNSKQFIVWRIIYSIHMLWTDITLAELTKFDTHFSQEINNVTAGEFIVLPTFRLTLKYEAKFEKISQNKIILIHPWNMSPNVTCRHRLRCYCPKSNFVGHHTVTIHCAIIQHCSQSVARGHETNCLKHGLLLTW